MPTPVIYDQYGRPARLPTEPLPDPRASFGRFRTARRRIENIKPPNVAAILRQAERGDPRAQAQLFDQMIDGDGRLPGNFGTRTKAVAKLDWQLHPASDDAADKRVCEWLRPQLKALRLHNSFQRLARAVGYGYGAEQIHWELRGGEVGVREITHWPTHHLLPDESGEIRRFVTAAGGYEGEDMQPAQFVVHTPGELNADPCVAGLLRPAAWFWFFKKFTLTAWLIFNEKYGQPFRVGKYPPGMSEEEQSAAFMNLVEMGAEAVAMLPDGMDVEFHQVAASMQGEAHSALAARCDDEITILLLGQTLTTSMAGGGGSYAAAKVHNEVRQDLLEWDAIQLQETIERDLVTPWVRFQFGQDVEIPQFELEVEDPVDLEARSRVYQVVVGELGLPVAASDMYAEFAIPAPADDAELLVVPRQGSTPPPAATTTFSAPHGNAGSACQICHGVRAPAAGGAAPPGKPLRSGTPTRPADLLVS